MWVRNVCLFRVLFQHGFNVSLIFFHHGDGVGGRLVRVEAEREAAWRAYVQASLASEATHGHQGAFFATAAVARHLLYVMLDRNVADENETSLVRARTRGAMRRFVLDVHQVARKRDAEIM